MIASDYANALNELLEKNSTQGQVYLQNMRKALARRGHDKLLPRIFAEYQKILLRKERSRAYQLITPQKEQTRILLELYRKLTHV